MLLFKFIDILKNLAKLEICYFKIHIKKHNIIKEETMKLFRLEKAVKVTGRDYFGRKAEITFTPTNPHQPGFFWDCNPGEKAIPISENLASTRSRQITLMHESRLLNVYEHIGVLRYAGIDGVKIASSQWPPFHGRPLELYDAIMEKTIPIQQSQQWITLTKRVQINYPGAMKRYTSLIPGGKPGLKIIVACEYEGVGYQELRFSLPRDNLKETFSAFAQGWPKWAYYPLRAAKFLGWPHLDHIEWSQKHKNDKAIELFCQHRLVDLLGGLSLLHPTKLFAGTVVSHCSGHWADVQATKKAQPFIKLLSA